MAERVTEREMAEAELAKLGGLAALRRVDPELAGRLDRAYANWRDDKPGAEAALLRGLGVCSAKLADSDRGEPSAAVRDVLADVQAVFPGAMLWDVRRVEPGSPNWEALGEGER